MEIKNIYKNYYTSTEPYKLSLKVVKITTNTK